MKNNKFFEEEFIKVQKESIFDYSIVSLAILDNEKFNKYEAEKKKCPNCNTKLVFHGTQIDNIAKIISAEFKYTKQAFYGMGVYFTKSLDYVLFYSGGNKMQNRRDNFNKILSPNSTFGLVASQVFYDKNLLKHIIDYSYYVNDLYDFPTYVQLKRKYPDKMVPKNGIHFINVKPENGHVIPDSPNSINENEKKNLLEMNSLLQN